METTETTTTEVTTAPQPVEQTVKPTTSWHTYPSLHTVGHKYVSSIFQDEVLVESKTDGSQFNFGVFNGVVKCRSKSVDINIDHPNQMFSLAVTIVKRLAEEGVLHDGWTYRGEYLQRARHNVLTYNRWPKNHVMIYDINTGPETYLSYDEKKAECDRIGFECTQRLFEGKVEDVNLLRNLLDTEDALGGPKIEGVVIKNYKRFTPDGKVMMAKLVSEAFKEVHDKKSSAGMGVSADIIAVLAARYRNEARWAKSVQHLKEAGTIEGIPEDIGKLLREINIDVLKECKDEIRDDLFNWGWKLLSKEITKGFPEWYKAELAKTAFEQGVENAKAD